MNLFGKEQAVLQKSPLRRFTFKVLGDLHFGMRRRIHYLDRMVRDLEVRTIFEAGCNRGQTSFWLHRKFPSAQITSIDISPTLIAHCQSIANHLGIPQITFQVADLANYQSVMGADLVICMDVLEHILDWQTAVKTLVKQLKPGSRLVIHTPHRGKYQHTRYGLRKLNLSDSDEPSEHVREGFVPEDFRLLSDLGLDYRVVFTFGWWVLNMHTFFELYRKHSQVWWMLFTPLLLLASRLENPVRNANGAGLLIVAQMPI